MLYLILILLPPALAVGCVLARERRWTDRLAVVLAATIGLGSILWMPTAHPASWLGTTLGLSPINGILLGSWLLIVLGGVLVSPVQPSGRTPVPIMLLMSGILSAALLSSQSASTSLLLVSVLILSSLLLGDTIPVALQYIAVAVLGAVFFVGASGLAVDLAGTRTGLVLAGLSMWVVLLPALLVFSDVDEQINLPALGVIVGALPSIVGIVVGYGIAADGRAAMAIALLALLPAGTLLLVPARPRRLLVMLLIADSCLMLPGLVGGSDDGLRGALLGCVAHAFAVVLLLAGLAAIERESGQTSAPSYMSVVVAIAGALILIGIPPLPGWFGRVASWNAARDAGMFSALLFGAGQLLLIAGAVRLVLSLVRRPRQTAVRAPVEHRGERRAHALLILLIVAAVLSGFAVGPLLDRIDVALTERGPVQSSGAAP